MSGFTNTNTHDNSAHSASHGNPVSNAVDALNPKTGSGVGSHGTNTGYNNDSSLTHGNHSTTGNPSHFQSTVASIDPARNTGNETSHNPLSSHNNNNNNNTTHSSNPLTHGTGTGYGTSSSTGNHGSAANDLNPTTGTGSHLPTSHHDNSGTGTHNLTSSGVPGHNHNNDSSRPGHGLDTSEVLSGHHSRADPHHDSSVAGSAGAHGLSLEQSRANAGGPTYPISGGSNPSVGTGAGAGAGHGSTGAHHGVGTDSTQHKPTIGEKVKGTVETLVGKATHNPAKIAEGEALKTGTAHGTTTGTGVGGAHSSTTGTHTGTHNAHDSSIPHGASGHSHTGVNDSDTFHNKHEGFAKEHNKDVSYGGSTLAGSGTGL